MITKEQAAKLRVGEVVYYRYKNTIREATVRAPAQISQYTSWFSLPVERSWVLDDILGVIELDDASYWYTDRAVVFRTINTRRIFRNI